MILQNGGNVAILDLNAENGNKVASELGSSARFFACDVTDSESIAGAVKGITAWISETGKTLGGIVPAAGIATPATVRFNPPAQAERGLPWIREGKRRGPAKKQS